MTAGVETLKVSSRSRPRSVAGALGTVLERDGEVVLHAIGAGAVNQAVKAIAIARGYLMPRGLEISTRIGFATLEVDGQERTAMRFRCRSEALDGEDAGEDAGAGR